MPISGWRVAPIIAAILLTALEASGQPQTVQEVMQKYGVIGTFASNCTSPISNQNPRAVYSVVDANRVQYELLTGAAERASVGVLDAAVEISPNVLGVSYLGQRGRINIVYRIEGNRLRLWTSSREDGRRLVVDGRYWPEDVETPWLTRCG